MSGGKPLESGPRLRGQLPAAQGLQLTTIRAIITMEVYR